jgi:hypothetical protein
MERVFLAVSFSSQAISLALVLHPNVFKEVGEEPEFV